MTHPDDLKELRECPFCGSNEVMLATELVVSPNGTSWLGRQKWKKGTMRVAFCVGCSARTRAEWDAAECGCCAEIWPRVKRALELFDERRTS